MEAAHSKIGIGCDHPALVLARHPVITRLARSSFQFIYHAKHETVFPRALKGRSDCLPPLLTQVGSLQPSAAMDVGPVHSMFNHLPNLLVNLSGIEFPVPEPERPDAVSAMRLLESRMKGLQRADRRRPGREMRRTAKVDSTNGGTGYPEKIPSCDLGHGRRFAAPLRGS